MTDKEIDNEDGSAYTWLDASGESPSDACRADWSAGVAPATYGINTPRDRDNYDCMKDGELS